MRERHPKLGLQRAYGWEDIPAGGIYTTADDALRAGKLKADVPFYEIDKRNAAFEALKAQRQRLSEREDALLATSPKAGDIDAARVRHYRLKVLNDAGSRHQTLDRAFETACEPLSDYTDIVRAATLAVDVALERESTVTLESIPGYLPDGSWLCDQCGFPSDSRGFTCGACDEADPGMREMYDSWTSGGSALAARLIEFRRQRWEALRWIPAAADQT